MKSATCSSILLFAAAMFAEGASFHEAPTSTSVTLMRGGPGKYGHPRGAGTHGGVDIVANQSSANKNIYAVRAVSAGKVAYAQINGSQTTGYGYTIVIDHKDDHYTLYAHLATAVTSALNLKIGDEVTEGQIIGYIADLQNGEKSSGNVAACVVAPYDKIQLHFEHFIAPSGRTSTGLISTLKQGGVMVDPTQGLKNLNYLVYPPPTNAPPCPANLAPES